MSMPTTTITTTETCIWAGGESNPNQECGSQTINTILTTTTLILSPVTTTTTWDHILCQQPGTAQNVVWTTTRAAC
eukprot:700560-Karenia_brevis.AAC.1